MHDKFHLSALGVSKLLLSTRLPAARVIVDATCGNGYDTCYLANCAIDSARIVAFDIQSQAIASTQERLRTIENAAAVELVCDSHENIAKYVDEVDLVVFNLGYLPGSDHDVITQAETTIRAVQKLLGLLNKNGMIVLVAYPGHPDGQVECDALEHYLSTLPQIDYNCGKFTMLNQKNAPAQIFIIEKR